jgi:hypothetical protein
MRALPPGHWCQPTQNRLASADKIVGTRERLVRGKTYRRSANHMFVLPDRAGSPQKKSNLVSKPANADKSIARAGASVGALDGMQSARRRVAVVLIGEPAPHHRLARVASPYDGWQGRHSCT